MPLASATDYATIGGWNLAGQFAKHRDQLVDAAQLGYKLLAASGIPPQAVDCEDAVRVHIHGSADFDIMMQAAQISYDFVIWICWPDVWPASCSTRSFTPSRIKLSCRA